MSLAFMQLCENEAVLIVRQTANESIIQAKSMMLQDPPQEAVSVMWSATQPSHKVLRMINYRPQYHREMNYDTNCFGANDQYRHIDLRAPLHLPNIANRSFIVK
jgi:hypothetical protein